MAQHKTTITRTRCVIDELVPLLAPCSVRAFAYALFNRKLIPNMSKSSTNTVSKLLVKLREAGLVDWSAVVDETRKPEVVPQWSDPASLIRAAVSQYRRNNWTDQPCRIEAWSEKGTVRGTVAPVLEEYGVDFRVLHGYGSATAVHDIAEGTWSDSTKPLIGLYLGDHDPSGLHMGEVDLPQRIKRYKGQVTIVRVALTKEDIARPDMQAAMFEAETKKKDTRHRWFIKSHGTQCWELDALPPNVLRARLAQTIESFMDPDAWAHAKRIEAAEIESMNTGMAGFMAAFRGLPSKRGEA